MSGECILIIDDSQEIVKHLAETVLPTFGYHTMHAYDGQSGLELIREKEPDLVMLDFNLPQMTGLDVLQQLAQESLKTPIILMTGYGSELSAIEAFRLGAKDYIIKPFTVDEIVETIDRALVETRLLHDKAKLAEQIRRLKVEMSRQNNEMRTLSNIGKAITSLLSVDEVLQRVLEAATYLTNAEESTIWLPDDAGRHLRPYDRQTPNQPNDPGPILSLTDSPAGQVMESGRPLRQSAMSGQGIKVKTGYFAHAVLYVPLQLRGITLGVLGISNRSARRAFSKQDEFLLSFLADYAAIALENARVFQAADQALATRLEELNTLIHITQTITSSLDLQEVIRLTIKQVHDSWHIEASSLWLLNETAQTLRVLANVGTAVEKLEKLELDVGQGIVGEVVRTGKPIYTNDVTSHEHHYREADEKTGFNTSSLLCVPLIFRGKVVGAMQLLNKIDGDFDEVDLERARAIAAAIAIAVSNALLFDEAESHKQQLDKARSQFLSTLSQDLSEPLRRINDLVAELKETGPLNREQAQLSRKMMQATEHLMNLLTGVIELARLDSSLEQEPEPCDILEIVTDVVHEFQPRAKIKHVAIVLTAEPGLHQIMGDPGQLRRAVSSLVENAIQFSPTEQKVQVTLFSKPDHMLIQVQDWGPGIAKNDLPHIFKKFYRGQAQDDSGSGLGLALAYSIADRHGGNLWAESKNGRGSTFYLKLPFSQTHLL